MKIKYLIPVYVLLFLTTLHAISFAMPIYSTVVVFFRGAAFYLGFFPIIVSIALFMIFLLVQNYKETRDRYIITIDIVYVVVFLFMCLNHAKIYSAYPFWMTGTVFTIMFVVNLIYVIYYINITKKTTS